MQLIININAFAHYLKNDIENLILNLNQYTFKYSDLPD